MIIIEVFLKVMVGVAGFKPTTSPTPRVRANQAAPYSAIKKTDSNISLLRYCLFLVFYLGLTCCFKSRGSKKSLICSNFLEVLVLMDISVSRGMTISLNFLISCLDGM